MLAQAHTVFEGLLHNGRSTVKLGAASLPASEQVIRRASTWVSFYPDALITRTNESVLHTLKAIVEHGCLQEMGIQAVFTTPLTRSGGVAGYAYTPSTDGRFDPISLEIDPALGTDQEYRALNHAANEQGMGIIGNLVPLHTGQGPDFLLALLGEPAYRALYMLSEIAEQDWQLLPPVDDGTPTDAEPVPTRPLNRQQTDALYENGYIPGQVKWVDAALDSSETTGWSATPVIVGADGKQRRWVYLHFFKPSQPVLNLDYPDGQALRVLNAAAIKQIRKLGVAGLRLDAIAFSVEEQAGTPITRDVYTPSATRKTNGFASLIRTMQGFSFQELMAPLGQVHESMEYGTDLTYDFFTRAAGLHAALTGNASLLRLMFRLLLAADIQPGSLVHDLQNHDELTYQLPELLWRGNDRFEVAEGHILGTDLQQQTLARMHAMIEPTPWNRLYRSERDGIATTLVGFLAAGLGIDPYQAGSAEVDCIRRAHLLLARANAMQPGVFCLSAWDLVGALPLRASEVDHRLLDGDDVRWFNRGGVDVLGLHPEDARSAGGLTRAQSLYGTLPEQLQQPQSFASQLQRMLAAREKYGIAQGELKALPPEPGPKQLGLCILAMELPVTPRYAITALNFSHQQGIDYPLDLAHVFGVKRRKVRHVSIVDVETGTDAKKDNVDQQGRYQIRLKPLEGKTVVLMNR